MLLTSLITYNGPGLDWYRVLSLFLWTCLLLGLWFWLRKELTTRKFLSIWESDGVLSTRLLAATALLVWAMSMYSSGRMKGDDLESVLQWVAAFFAVGSVAKAAGAIKGPTTVNAKEVKEMNVGETGTPNPPAGQTSE